MDICLKANLCVFLFLFVGYTTVYCVAGAPAGHNGDNSFTIQHATLRLCLQGDGLHVSLANCTGIPAQRWKWGSGHRLFHVTSARCLGLQRGSRTPALLGCGSTADALWWRCTDGTVHTLSQMSLSVESGTVIVQLKFQEAWTKDNSSDSICHQPYQVLHTTMGNSFGAPCEFPFYHNGSWHHGCLSHGQQGGYSWCATTPDYDKDQKWGFCLKPEQSCEVFWENSGQGSCYQYNLQSALSWHEARASCRSQGGDLLSISSSEELSFKAADANYPEKMWIGLNQLDMAQGWQWSDGTPLTFVKWDKEMTFPSVLRASDCGVMNSQGFWERDTCGKRLPYICKKQLNVTENDTGVPLQEKSTSCDLGWRPWDGFCYKLVSEWLAMEEAQQWCMKNNSELISLHSLADVEVLSAELQMGNESDVWTGLKSEGNPNLFNWTDRSPVSFTYWARDEPSCVNESEAACVAYSGQYHLWKVTACNKRLPFVCKRIGEVKEITDKTGCPEDGEWKRHGQACYKVDTNAVLHKDRCDLTIRNRFEQLFINNLIKGHTTPETQYFWTGLRDENSTGEFQWISKGGQSQDVTFTNWNSFQPARAGGCVAMSREPVGRWEVKDCEKFTAGSVCKKELGPQEEPEPEPDPSLPCPPGWTSSSGSHYCYQVFHEEKLSRKRTWEEADRFCQALGAHLASVSYSSEIRDLAGILSDNRYFWIGLNRRSTQSENAWEWSDGRPVSTGIIFGEDQEDNEYNQDCAALKMQPRIRSSYGRFLWPYSWSLHISPFHCDAQLEWVCQVPKGKMDIPIPEWYNPSAHHESSFFVEGREFWFVADKLTYEEAREYCWNSESRLAIVSTRSSVIHIQEKLSKILKDEQGCWVDVDDASNHLVMRQFHFYHHQDPCSFLSLWDYRKGTVNLRTCGRPLPFLCERFNITSVEKQPLEPPHVGLPCDSGSLAFKDKCYTVIKPLYLSIQRARDKCHTLRGTLVTIANQAEQDFITTLLPEQPMKFWIGLKLTLNGMLWDDDSRSTFHNFNPLLDKYYKWNVYGSKFEDQCVYVFHDSHPEMMGTWDYTPCTDQQYVSICQHYADKPESTRFPEAKFKVGNHTYKVLQGNLTWSEALQQCKEENMDLASVADPFQQASLTVAVSRANTSMWIGLFSADDGFHYRWSDNSPVTFSRWSSEATSGHCVHLDTDGFWKAIECDNKLAGAICHIHDGAGSEIAFVLDGSKRIEPENYQKAKDFIASVMKNVWETCFGCDFAVVQYGKGTRTEVSLRESRDQIKALDKVRSIKQSMEETNPASVLQHILDNVFAPENWSRESSKKIIVLLMDGRTVLDTKNITYTMEFEKMKNIHRFAIRVGSIGTRSEELNKFVSNPNDKHLFVLENYDDREDVESQLEKTINEGTGVIIPESDDIAVKCPQKFGGPNWIPFRNNCYTFQLDSSRWNSLKTGKVLETCKKLDRDADILTIRDEKENEFVQKQLLPFRDLVQYVWLGMFRDENVNRLKWYDGTNVQYSNWKNGRLEEAGIFMALLNLRGVWELTMQPWPTATMTRTIVACKIDNDPKEEFQKSSDELRTYGNHSYYIIQRKLTWYDALQECASRGGHLASVHDSAHHTHLEMLSKIDGFPLWIGLSSQDASSSFEWSDGTDYDYSLAGFANVSSVESCVSVDTKGSWVRMNCRAKQEGAICYNSTVQSSRPELRSGSTNCPQDSSSTRWIEYGGHCYMFDMAFFNYSVYTMEEAKHICASLESELLIIRDGEENEFVSRYLSENPLITSRAWLGMDLGSQGQPVSWLDGTSLRFSNWDNSTNTSLDSKRGCVVLMSGKGGTWMPVSCRDTRGRTVCKMPIRSGRTRVLLASFFIVLVSLISAVMFALYRRNRARLFSTVRYQRSLDDADTAHIINQTD